MKPLRNDFRFVQQLRSKNIALLRAIEGISKRSVSQKERRFFPGYFSGKFLRNVLMGILATTEKAEECPLLAIFYCEFDNVAGSCLVCQYPEKKKSKHPHLRLFSAGIAMPPRSRLRPNAKLAHSLLVRDPEMLTCERCGTILYTSVFTKEHHDMFSRQLITKEEWSERVMVVDSMALPWALVSYPVMMESLKYERNLFGFNVSFVCARGNFATEPFEWVLQKFGRWLRLMEWKSGYLCGPGSKAGLQEMLEHVYVGIKRDGEALLLYQDTVLQLKPYRRRTPLKKWWTIQDQDVPVRRCIGLAEAVDELSATHPDAESMAMFDLALLQVMPHINGVKHVKKISIDSEVDIDVVKGALQWALYTKQIAISDTFRYGNVYVQTSTAKAYMNDPGFPTACWERIAKTIPSPGDDAMSDGGEEEAYLSQPGPGFRGLLTASASGGGGEGEGRQVAPPPHPMCLLRLYDLFQRDRTVGDVLREVGGTEGFAEEIDHRRMCLFGVETGILRRLHCYPICVSNAERAREEGGSGSDTGGPKDQKTPAAWKGRGSLQERFDLKTVQELANGRRTEDALCCLLECSPEELEWFLRSDGSTKLHWYYPH